MDVSVGDGRDTGLFTQVVLGSLVLVRDRGCGAKCAAAANKPVNRSGGQRFFLSPRSLAAARLPWSFVGGLFERFLKQRRSPAEPVDSEQITRDRAAKNMPCALTVAAKIPHNSTQRI